MSDGSGRSWKVNIVVHEEIWKARRKQHLERTVALAKGRSLWTSGWMNFKQQKVGSTPGFAGFGLDLLGLRDNLQTTEKNAIIQKSISECWENQFFFVSFLSCSDDIFCVLADLAILVQMKKLHQGVNVWKKRTSFSSTIWRWLKTRNKTKKKWKWTMLSGFSLKRFWKGRASLTNILETSARPGNLTHRVSLLNVVVAVGDELVGHLGDVDEAVHLEFKMRIGKKRITQTHVHTQTLEPANLSDERYNGFEQKGCQRIQQHQETQCWGGRKKRNVPQGNWKPKIIARLFTSWILIWSMALSIQSWVQEWLVWGEFIGGRWGGKGLTSFFHWYALDFARTLRVLSMHKVLHSVLEVRKISKSSQGNR